MVMNIKRTSIVGTCIAVALIGAECKKENQKNASPDQNATVNLQNQSTGEQSQNFATKGIVCIWDGLIIRETPLKNAKTLSTMSLGETVIDLDSSSIDANDKKREYYKVRLSDGKEGWTPSYGAIKNASPAVFKTNASLYKRPDLLTITETRFEPMEFVAITSSMEDWIEVTSEQKKKIGWVKKDAITKAPEDIATAVLINKKFLSDDGLSNTDKIKTLITDAPYPSSIFIGMLQQKLVAESLLIVSNQIVDDAHTTVNLQTIDTSKATANCPNTQEPQQSIE
jgi:hypothetical protein